jgi:hypothetical protein
MIAIRRLSSEKNFIVGYKGYAPEGLSFGRMKSSFVAPQGVRSSRFRRLSRRQPANSPVGAISRRRAPLKGHAVFYPVLGACAPRPAGRRVRGVQLGRTAELVSIVAGRGRAVVTQGRTRIALDHPGAIFMGHRARPNTAGCQARDNKQTDEYLHGSSLASCGDARPLLYDTHKHALESRPRGSARRPMSMSGGVLLSFDADDARTRDIVTRSRSRIIQRCSFLIFATGAGKACRRRISRRDHSRSIGKPLYAIVRINSDRSGFLRTAIAARRTLESISFRAFFESGAASTSAT